MKYSITSPKVRRLHLKISFLTSPVFLYRSLWTLVVFILTSPQPALSSSDCFSIFNSAIKPYQDLLKQLPKDQAKISTDKPVAKMLQLNKKLCKTQQGQKQIIKTTSQALGDHSARIGVILPLSGTHRNKGQAILEGMKAAFPFRGYSFQQRVIVYDSQSNQGTLQRLLAGLVLHKRVAMIIGGATAKEARTLSKWAPKLRLPIINLSPDIYQKPSRYLFQFSPHPLSISDFLANHIRKRGFKNVAIIGPKSTKRANFPAFLQASLKKRGIGSELYFQYAPHDFQSMKNVAQKLLQIDNSTRKEEYLQLVNEGKSEAKKQGMPFIPSLVALPPIVDFDALFIDDHFRNVRHLIKVLQFLGLKKTTLIGTPKWRSLGLIDPPEPFLEGAFFIDVLGRFSDLPKQLQPQETLTSYLTSSDIAVNLDHQILGYYSIRTSDRTLVKGMPGRRHLYRSLKKLHHKKSRFFGSGPVYDPNQHSIWPSFIFTVRSNSIKPLGIPRLAHKREGVAK